MTYENQYLFYIPIQTEKEIRKVIPLIIALKPKPKISRNHELKDLYNGICKTLKKEVEEDTRR
jgi:hypothetical protein